MISTASIIFCAIATVLTIVLPLAGILLYTRKHLGEKMLLYWLLGATGFFITQIVIRVPLLTVLQTQPWFIRLQTNHLALYGFLLAFTAGLFELAGRFAVAMWMKKKGNLTFHRSIAAGLGHGGIEAMLLVGSSYASYLVLMLMINGGTFENLIAEGVDASQMYMIRDILINQAPGLYLLGVYERILTMTAHLGMSVLVCYGCYCGKPGKHALICLLIHTFIDMSAVINAMVGGTFTQTAAYIIIYTILTAVAIASIILVRRIHKIWKETEVTHETA